MKHQVHKEDIAILNLCATDHRIANMSMKT